MKKRQMGRSSSHGQLLQDPNSKTVEEVLNRSPLVLSRLYQGVRSRGSGVSVAFG